MSEVVPPVLLPQELARQIEREGVNAFPNECCGMMIGRDERDASGQIVRREVERLVIGRNAFATDEQYHRFSIDPFQQMQVERDAEKQGKQLLGFYHSHPDHPARPSEYDREHAWETFSYIIVSILSRAPADMTCWTLEPGSRTFQQQDIVGQSSQT